MAARLRRRALSLLFLLFAALSLASPSWGAPPADAERRLRDRAQAGAWNDVLAELADLARREPDRYRDGRFDYLAAHALAALGRTDDALPRFTQFIAPGDLFDVPSRLAAARLHFARGNGVVAVDLLLPLLQGRPGAIFRRAVRTALDALESPRDGTFDAAALDRLVAAHAPLAPRERRRLTALRAEALERAGRASEAAALRAAVLSEGRRDDAAAIVLARELRDLRGGFDAIPAPLLSLLIETARAQRDLDLAERLAEERVRRAGPHALSPQALADRFELFRIKASRGKFAEAAAGYRALLADRATALVPGRSPKDDAPGTAGFFGRVRFNLGAVLEKLGDLDAAAAELLRVEREGAGPAALASLQRARLLLRRGSLDAAEAIFSRASLGKEAGRTEGLLLLLLRRAEAGDAAGASRALARVARSGRRTTEPWRSELSFWRGRVAEAAGDASGALGAYAALLGARPYSIAAELAKERVRALPAAVREPWLRRLRLSGERALKEGDLRPAKGSLLVAALLGDRAAKDALKVTYSRLPAYTDVLLAPDLPDEELPYLCGDAGACRLLQLGLAEEAEPIVYDARRLDSLTGCILAARLSEGADAGPAALEAAEALDGKVPDDFLLDLAPRSIARALAPRPFDRLVEATAQEFGTPADLLYAVMRQESRFDREAASPAAARGLMQLTLPAAGEAARELNEELPAYADLYDPARSLRLGATTLKSLLARFGGDARCAVAGYNAGAGQTALWLGGAANAGEALLGAISYGETRTYFRRVLKNRLLYGEARTPTVDRRGSASTP